MGEYPDLKIIPLYRSERGQKGRHDGFLGLFRMAAAIRSTQAEEVWILHRSWRYGLAALIAGIPLRSGYGLGKQRYFLNGNQGLPKALKGAHPRDAVTHFCAEKGITPEDDHPQIKVSDDEVRAARSLLPDHCPPDHWGMELADVLACLRFSSRRFRLNWHIEPPVFRVAEGQRRAVLTLIEQKKLVKQAIKEEGLEVRVAVCVLLLQQGGLMVSEISRLRNEDIRLSGKYPYIAIVGKTKKEARKRV
ncbi:MAG: hypothetical protein EBU10_07700, partial [Alphaproteobacteria bacterium]|nr:hypothetical protein [Alphaproteobacteria bacterium]